MLSNLRAEMARNNISVGDIAKTIDRTERTVRDRIKGKTDFPLPDAVVIRDRYFPGMPVEYLFAVVPDEGA